MCFRQAVTMASLVAFSLQSSAHRCAHALHKQAVGDISERHSASISPAAHMASVCSANWANRFSAIAWRISDIRCW